MYVFAQHLPGCTLSGVLCPREGELARLIAQCSRLRYVHCPSMRMRCAGVSPAASVSPQVKPMRVSLTSGEGVLRIPSFMRSPIVEGWPTPARGGVVGLVLNRGSVVGGLLPEFAVSPRGIVHAPSPARSSISLTVCGGPFKFE